MCIDDQTRTVNYLLTKSLDLLGAYNYNQFRQFRHDSESSEPVNLKMATKRLKFHLKSYHIDIDLADKG